LFLSWLQLEWERKFSDTNIEIGKTLPALQLNASVIIIRTFARMMTEEFSQKAGNFLLISKLVSENSLSCLYK